MSEKITALVTGASRGIGAAIAHRLTEDGYFVVGTATSQDGAQAIDERLGDHGVGIRLDVADSDSVANVAGLIGEKAPMPLIVVNNAGVTKDNLLMRMSDAEWNEVIETNLSGAFRVTKPMLRGMLKARWGRVINVGSVVGRLGNPGQGNYVASKAGLEGFTRSLAMEVASRGITVNAVAPGFIETDMTNHFQDEELENILNQIPANKMGNPQQIADLALFLASSKGDYITGQTISVDGGLYMS